MEAVAAHVVLRVPLIRHGIHEGLLRHRLMEGGIHDDRVRHARHELHRALDAHDVRGHVERSERDERLELLDDLLVDKRGFLEKLSSMEDPVAYRTDLAEALDASIGRIDKHLEDKFDRFLVRRGYEALVVLFLAGRLLLDR